MSLVVNHHFRKAAFVHYGMVQPVVNDCSCDSEIHLYETEQRKRPTLTEKVHYVQGMGVQGSVILQLFRFVIHRKVEIP